MNASLIIPTHNRPDTLRRTLTAICALETLPDEIIVVDDGSPAPPGSNFKFQILNFKLRLIRQPHRGVAAARNTGIRAARSTICCFLDDDCQPEPDWLEQLLQPFTDPDVVGVSGAIHYVSPSYRPAPGDRVIQNPRGEWPMAGNMAYRRELLYRLGGFNELLAAYEDKDLALRAWRHGRIQPAPQAIVTHALERWTDDLLARKARNASVWVMLANLHDLVTDKNNPPPIRWGILFSRDYLALCKHTILIPLFVLAGIFNRTARRRAAWEMRWVRFLLRQRHHIWRESLRNDKILL